jgi:hypothetical protein
MFSCCTSKKILTQIDTTCTVKNSINTDESFVDVPITPKEIKQDSVILEPVLQDTVTIIQEPVIQEPVQEPILDTLIQEPVIKVSLLPSTDEEREIQEAKDALIALELYEAKNGLNMYVSSDSESN